MLVAFGYSKYGLSKAVLFGGIGEIGCVLWLVWERWITYVAIEGSRLLVNSEQKLIPAPFEVDVASILYVARFPHFIFRSWGGRMVIFFKDEHGEVRQTAFPETLYSWETLKAILKKLTSIKPTIEIDPQYMSLLNARDNSIEEDLSQQLPRPVHEIEAYVAQKYGLPQSRIGYRTRVLIQGVVAVALLLFAGAVLTFT